MQCVLRCVAVCVAVGFWSGVNGIVRVCVCACVRAMKETQLLVVKIQFFTNFISILDISETQHIISSTGQGH